LEDGIEPSSHWKIAMDEYQTRQTLLERACNRDDEAAWTEFVGYYRNFIYMVVRKMGIRYPDDDDMVQAVTLKIWKSLDRFKVDDERAKFRTWLSTVIRNTAINHINQRKRQFDGQQTMEDNRNVMPHFLETISQPEVNRLIFSEWEAYVTNLAMENIKPLFSDRAIEIFSQMLDGAEPRVLAEQFGIKENSVHKLKNRVKSRLVEEIRRIRGDLE
jgi:RNA polymerase sigma factor (sigma-70 family)